MKKIIAVILIISMLTFALYSCEEDESWREKDIHGAYEYETGGGIIYIKHTLDLSILICNSFVLKSTKIRFKEVSSNEIENYNVYLSYGTFEIIKIWNEEDHVCYVLELNYIEKDENIKENDNTIQIIVKKTETYCLGYESTTIHKIY